MLLKEINAGSPLLQESIGSGMTGEKTTRAYWEETHLQPRWQLPSRLNVGTRNVMRLLVDKVQPEMRVLEIGCAPGKHLAYLARKRRARVCGLDYSEPGIAHCRDLFSRLGLEGEFRCEDIFATLLPEGSFDLVYSLGVIEHFDDPRPLIDKHLRLAKNGGLVLITVPNYAGLYGRLQTYFDPENLKLHNLDVMSRETLASLAQNTLACESEVHRCGRLSPWVIHLQKRWPEPIARLISHALNTLGLVQPFDIGILCPMLVLSIRRKQIFADSMPGLI